MNVAEKLRHHRKALVTAAEKVAGDMFAGDRRPSLKKTQLNHLIGVCGEASCAEEIENYIRYQAGRTNTGWRPALATDVIAGVKATLDKVEGGDPARVEAWRLYAIFLTRAFTYRMAGGR